MTKELHKHSITELIKGYKEKSFSPLEVAEEIIKKINSQNKKLNAFVHFDEEYVLQQAASSNVKYDNNQARGYLEGVPISIKDLIVTNNMPTNRGSLTSSLPVNSDFDAPVVKKLKKKARLSWVKPHLQSLGIKEQLKV